MKLIFAQNLRTIPASAEEQSLKFSIKVVNKTAQGRRQRQIRGGTKRKKLKSIMVIISVVCGIQNAA